MNEDNGVDPSANLSMPRYEEVREQILNHSLHDIPQSALSPEFGFEVFHIFIIFISCIMKIHIR